MRHLWRKGSELYRRVTDYFRFKIWLPRLQDLHGARRHGFRLFRTVYFAVRGFISDRCDQQAASLTILSLYAIVPAAAIALAVASAFGLGRSLEGFIRANANWRGEIVDLMVKFAHTITDRGRTGLIGIVGLVVLCWSVISVIGATETAFNNIRGIRSPRRWPRRLGDYLIGLGAGTILLIFSSAVAVVAESRLRILGQLFPGGGLVADVILRLLSLVIAGALFTLLYKVIPNERVATRPAAFGGFIAAAIYLVIQWAYVKLQVGVSQAAAIYGGFAVIPLFLVWAQMSWSVVLFGAELSFAYENAETYGFQPDYARLSSAGRRLLGLRIMVLLSRNTLSAAPPLTADEVSRKLEIPHRLVRHLLQALVDTKLANVVRHEPRTYTSVEGAEAMPVREVMDKLDRYRGMELPQSEQDAGVLSVPFDEFGRAIEQLPDEARLSDIA